MSIQERPDAEAVQPAYLFARFEPQADPVSHPKIEVLPLHDRLSPGNFEKLVARLANPVNGSNIQAFRYGKSGSTQGGIDIICIDAAAQKCDYYEGKRVLEIKKGEIKKWVDRFLSGPHIVDARSFTLCTTYYVSESTVLLSEWKECAYLLASKGIAATLWDSDQIHVLLRHRRDIVSELFNDQVAEHYCVQNEPSVDIPPDRTFDTKRVSVFGRIAYIQNISIACDVALPSADSLSASASFAFARRDLSGITITASGKEIVHWMQWRAHAANDSARPYALPMPHRDKTDGQYVFMGNSARLVLNQGELMDLDWALGKAWEEFRRASMDVLLPMRCLRFKRLEGSNAFGLISVQRELWQAMLNFAQEFDVAKGNSPWHLFDSAPGCLKAYSSDDSERFDRGYHAVLYAYNLNGIWMPWERSVVIGWSPPMDISGQPSEISPRKAWDAQYTHDWLLQELIPEVLRWVATQQQQDSLKKSFWRSTSQEKPQPIAVDRVASSRAIGLNWKVVPAGSRQELLECVSTLQSYAAARRSEVEIPPELAQGILLSIDRALPFARLSNDSFLRSTLSLPEGEDMGLAIRQRAKDCVKSVYYSTIDFMLRGLLAILDAAPNIPHGELGQIGAMLQPVLDRYHEDTVCALFTER